jgi:hypothetical protein
MAGLDDLYAQIPTGDIADRLGVDEAAVNSAVQTLVPALVGGLQQKAQDPGHASAIESAAGDHAARGLLDAGGGFGDVEHAGGDQAVANLFGGSDSSQVAAALAGGEAANSELFEKLLPILTPIVLAYIGKQLSQKKSPAPKKGNTSGGALDDVLGSILSGMSGGNKSLGSVLGKAIGSKAGDILGGLFGGKK